MFLYEILIVVLSVVLDIATKVLAETFLINNKVSLIDGVLSFVFVKNEGAAFGMMQGGRTFFIILTAIVVPVVVFFLFRYKNANKLLRVAVSLMLGGTLGNLFDRIWLSYVRDFIYFELIDFPVFNIADSCLTVGAILLIIYALFVYKEKPAEVKVVEEKSENGEEKDD